MARRHLAPHALSDLSYHEFFDAVTVVAPRSGHEDTDDGDDNKNDDGNRDKASEVHWRLASPDTTDASASSEHSNAPTATALTQRKGKSADTDMDASESTAADSQQQQRERQNATILWFSSLPPSDLRQAQTHFRSGTSALLSRDGTCLLEHTMCSHRDAMGLL